MGLRSEKQVAAMHGNTTSGTIWQRFNSLLHLGASRFTDGCSRRGNRLVAHHDMQGREMVC
jgi:hypothetical protein